MALPLPELFLAGLIANELNRRKKTCKIQSSSPKQVNEIF